jgi:PAS domain S-box-containing protein
MYAAALLGEVARSLEAPLIAVSCHAVVSDAAALLVARHARVLLLLDERGPAGVLSAEALVRALLEDPTGVVAAFAEGPPGVLAGNPTVEDARAAAAAAGSSWAYWQRHETDGVLYRIAELPPDLAEQRRTGREASMFRQAVEQSPVSIVITGLDGAIEYVNPRFTEITGFSPAEALGKNPRIVQSGNTPHAVYQQMWDTIMAGGEWSGSIQNRRKDGELYWEQVRIAPVRGEHGVVVNFVAVKEDVTRQRELEARTRMLASVFENARDGLLVASAEGFVAEINDGFTELTGRPRGDFLGLHVSAVGDAGSPEDAASFASALDVAGPWKGDRSFTRPSGEVVTAQVSIDAVRDPAGITTHFIGVCTDVTPLKNQQRWLAAQARTDALTGLLNRAGLLEALERALARRRAGGTLVAVGLLDLDGFKSINDRYGHDAGDALLCEAGRRLRGHLRANDIVARLGGDEFVVVLEGLRVAADLEDSAARLVRSLARPFQIGSQLPPAERVA